MEYYNNIFFNDHTTYIN